MASMLGLGCHQHVSSRHAWTNPSPRMAYLPLGKGSLPLAVASESLQIGMGMYPLALHCIPYADQEPMAFASKKASVQASAMARNLQ